jgi:hypothetical protein
MQDGLALRQPVVVVLGMHRSGTSLVMHLASRLGVAIDDELVPPARDNPRGFFEARAIVEAHDRILAAFGRTWRSAFDAEPLPEAWWRSPAIAAERATLAAHVRQATADPGRLWGFKDPRTVRLLPLWREILGCLALTPRFVVAVRRPEAVVASLVRRSALPASLAAQLWVEHNRAALALTRPKERVLVDYDCLLAHPGREVGRLAAFLGLPARQDAVLLVEPALNHAPWRRQGTGEGCLGGEGS